MIVVFLHIRLSGEKSLYLLFVSSFVAVFTRPRVFPLWNSCEFSSSLDKFLYQSHIPVNPNFDTTTQISKKSVTGCFVCASSI